MAFDAYFGYDRFVKVVVFDGYGDGAINVGAGRNFNFAGGRVDDCRNFVSVFIFGRDFGVFVRVRYFDAGALFVIGRFNVGRLRVVNGGLRFSIFPNSVYRFCFCYIF